MLGTILLILAGMGALLVTISTYLAYVSHKAFRARPMLGDEVQRKTYKNSDADKGVIEAFWWKNYSKVLVRNMLGETFWVNVDELYLRGKTEQILVRSSKARKERLAQRVK